MKYFFLITDPDNNDRAFLEELSAAPVEDYEFGECISLEKRFPKGVVMSMSKDDPDFRVLYDVVNNMDSLLIVSKPFKELLEKEDCGKIEYLPISIKDQRNKIASTDYFIVNLIDSVDYIDNEKSTVVYSALDDDLIVDIQKVVLNEKNIPKGCSLFRSKSYPFGYVVSDKLKKAIEKANMENIKFVEAAKFDTSLL
jgi:hypothetical protein